MYAKRNFVILSIILLVTVAIYASTWSAQPLVWDDGSNIFANPFYTMHLWWGVWLAPYFGLYVPVTSSAWALLYNLGHGTPGPFHAFNLFLHLANIILVFLMLNELAKKWALQPLAAVLAVTVFAFHPLQVETVAWISGGRDLLSTFFALLSVFIYFRCATKSGYLVATLSYALALLSKPNVAIVPLAVLAIDLWICKKPWRAVATRMSLWVAMSLAAIAVTQAAQVEHFVNRTEWWQRPLLMLDTYVFYIQKLIWPYPLSGNYAHTQDRIFADPLSLAIAAIIAMAIAVAIYWRSDRRYRIVGLWFLLLLPVSGIVPFGYENISQVADHYAYLPMAAIAAAFMLKCHQLLSKNKYLAFVPITFAAGWVAVSFARTPVWQNDAAFYTDMAKTAPDSYSTAIGMSVVLCDQQKDYDNGVKWVDKALAAEPDEIHALANKATCLLRAGRQKEVLDLDPALDRLDLDKLEATQPTAYTSFLASLGSAFIEEHEYEAGFDYLCEAYRIRPTEPNHIQNLKVAKEILQRLGLNTECPPN